MFGFAGADGITRSSDHKWWSDPRAWVITIHKNAIEMFFECLNVRVINISICYMYEYVLHLFSKRSIKRTCLTWLPERCFQTSTSFSLALIGSTMVLKDTIDSVVMAFQIENIIFFFTFWLFEWNLSNFFRMWMRLNLKFCFASVNWLGYQNEPNFADA